MAKKLINVRVDTELADAAMELAAQRGETVTAVMVRALQDYLAAGGTGEPAKPARRKKAAEAERPSLKRPDRDSCPHPRARVLKGLCYACGTAV